MSTLCMVAAGVVAALLLIHLAKRIAAPIRTTIYLESGRVIRINLRRMEVSPSSLAWTGSKLAGEYLHLPAAEKVQAIKMVNRLWNF